MGTTSLYYLAPPTSSTPKNLRFPSRLTCQCSQSSHRSPWASVKIPEQTQVTLCPLGLHKVCLGEMLMLGKHWALRALDSLRHKLFTCQSPQPYSDPFKAAPMALLFQREKKDYLT